MNDQELYNMLKKNYPNPLKVLPMILIFVPVTYMGFQFPEVTPIILVVEAFILFVFSYTVIKFCIERNTVFNLYKSNDKQELLRLLINKLEMMADCTPTDPAEHLSQVNRLKELILCLDEEALNDYDKRSPSKRIDDHLYKISSELDKHPKTVISSLFPFNLMVVLFFVLDFTVFDNPVDWIRALLTFIVLNIIAGSFFLISYRTKKKEMQVVETYKTDPDSAIEYYEKIKRKSVKPFGTPKKQKQESNAYYDHIIQMFVDFKDNNKHILKQEQDIK